MATTSKIMIHGGVPTLFVNDTPLPAMAYITYLSENNCYADFAGAGYKLFSFPVYFGGRGINTISKIKPFEKGIYDTSGEPDFSLFDNGVELIVKHCPDALIFPRVNMMLPEWWEQENPL